MLKWSARPRLCMHTRAFIDSEADVDGRPLTEEERCRLETNLPQLIRLMDPAELSGKLLEVEVIGHEQYEHIRSQSTAMDMNNELVDILVRRSYADYKQFLIALHDTGQQHVADVLINGGGQSTEAYVILHGFPTSMEFSQRGISGFREGIGIGRLKLLGN